jgi:hypothetical protein
MRAVAVIDQKVNIKMLLPSTNYLDRLISSLCHVMAYNFADELCGLKCHFASGTQPAVAKAFVTYSARIAFRDAGNFTGTGSCPSFPKVLTTCASRAAR